MDLDPNERVFRFEHQIQRVIHYFKLEFEMTYAEVIGVLELEKQRMCLEAMDDEDDDGDDDQDVESPVVPSGAAL